MDYSNATPVLNLLLLGIVIVLLQVVVIISIL
jgi:hypothetical protein